MSRTSTGVTSTDQPKTTAYIFGSGWKLTYVKKFMGATAEADAIAEGASNTFRGYDFTVSPDGNTGNFTLTMTSRQAPAGSQIGGTQTEDPNTPLNDVWELQPNVVEKDLMDADLTAINALTTEQKKKVDTDVNNSALSTVPDYSSYGATPAATMGKLYKLMVAGVKSVRVFAPVLRHTRLVRRDYGVADALTNVGKVIAASSFRTYETIPGVLLFSLPTATTVTRDSLTLYYGWFKKYPSVTQVAEGQYQLVQEFEYGLWSADLYTVLT